MKSLGAGFSYLELADDIEVLLENFEFSMDDQEANNKLESCIENSLKSYMVI